MRIEVDDLSREEVVALLDLHLREAHAKSPPGSAFAFDLSGLQHPSVTVWTAWDDHRLLGIGALRELAPDHGEIKSMRTAPHALRRGVAKTMLNHLISEARARGYRRVSLETGTNAAYAPARAMYEAAGFRESGPFGEYQLTEFNRCYALTF